MQSTFGKLLRRSLGCLAACLVLAAFGSLVPSSLAATPPCPEGSTPIALVNLASFGLPSEVPDGVTVVLARITLDPGEIIQPESRVYIAYFVESGMLKFKMSRRVGGFHLENPPQCVSATGEISAGGIRSVDDQGWMHIDAGTALIVEEVPIEQIGNAGNEPLELLQVILRFPEIDPATGQPVGDELVTSRGNQERQNDRRGRREATPTP